jgi:hypothetical protein
VKRAFNLQACKNSSMFHARSECRGTQHMKAISRADSFCAATTLRRRPLASIKSEMHDEKQAVNRLSICIVFIVSMLQKQLMETTSPTIDLHNLFLK